MDPNLQNGSIPPPPPAEVKVRTMRSDLETMAKSGGGLPQFQNVTVAGLAIEREAPAAVAAPEAAQEMARAEAATAAPPAVSAEAPIGREVAPPAEAPGSSRNFVGIVLVIVVAILAIAAVAYFAYKELGTGTPPAQTSAQ